MALGQGRQRLADHPAGKTHGEGVLYLARQAPDVIGTRGD